VLTSSSDQVVGASFPIDDESDQDTRFDNGWVGIVNNRGTTDETLSVFAIWRAFREHKTRHSALAGNVPGCAMAGYG
jgi:hypothetical protein